MRSIGPVLPISERGNFSLQGYQYSKLSRVGRYGNSQKLSSCRYLHSQRVSQNTAPMPPEERVQSLLRNQSITAANAVLYRAPTSLSSAVKSLLAPPDPTPHIFRVNTSRACIFLLLEKQTDRHAVNTQGTIQPPFFSSRSANLSAREHGVRKDPCHRISLGSEVTPCIIIYHSIHLPLSLWGVMGSTFGCQGLVSMRWTIFNQRDVWLLIVIIDIGSILTTKSHKEQPDLCSRFISTATPMHARSGCGGAAAVEHLRRPLKSTPVIRLLGRGCDKSTFMISVSEPANARGLSSDLKLGL
ncbi:uncharacterized protein H6S33_007211 [Morchella sextelata]|uniref:uncharacterized protein n=1 Tax=Morchella sextelata TaxID=1174677 RepID=UPI001D03B0DB|nr:uncharacterized protein H6S33_007211 [Morchella sextelata]KAH0604180.1 hypothetical protein H6S33_007211 [Morchella sextelata]